jgi:tetratricopeptide (TPR) repeat protein
VLGKTVSHYRITARLGSGGMGEVWLAEDIRLGHEVAIKRLPAALAGDRRARQRFMREARAVASMRHPYVVALNEFDEIDGEFYLITEYAPGGSLRERIADSPGGLDPGTAVRWGIQAAEGLAAAHAQDILHRDIKPDNLLLSVDDDLKIADFGLATLADTTRMTQDGALIGTLAYMAPEQRSGQDTSERTDLYALGLTLYEMLTGRRPHPDAAASGDWTAASFPGRNPDLPAELATLLDELLSADPSARPRSASEVARRLREIAGAAELVSGLPAPVRPRPPGVRRRALWALPVIVALGFAWWFAARDDDIGPVLDDASIAVMRFTRVADPADPSHDGETVSRLVATALSQRPNLQVVSRERLLELGNQPGNPSALPLARTVGSRWMVTGTVLRSAPDWSIIAELVDVRSGSVQGSRQVNAEETEDLFSLCDRLSSSLFKLIPDAATAAFTPRELASVTTTSEEAWRHYIDGVVARDEKDGVAAKRSLLQAVRADSTFAMAWLELATGPATVDAAEKARAMAQALRHSDHLSRNEQLLIRGHDARRRGDLDSALEHFEALTDEYPREKEGFRLLAATLYQTGDLRGAIRNYRRMTEIDPNDGLAFNMLAYRYFDAGQTDSSLIAINRYVELEPDLPDPYDSRADLHALNGDFEQAKASYREALAQRRGFTPSRGKLGALLLFDAEFRAADESFRRVASSESPTSRSLGRLLFGFARIGEGRFADAVDVLRQGIASDELEGLTHASYYRWKRCYLALALQLAGQPEAALKTMRQLVAHYEERMGPDAAYRHQLVLLLAQQGDFDAAEAELQALREFERTDAGGFSDDYWMTSAELAWHRGDAHAALAHLERLPPPKRGSQTLYVKGLAHLQADDLASAVESFDGFFGARYPSDSWLVIEITRAHYYLGLAYERSGWEDRARARYLEFLRRWGDAEPEPPEVIDARARLAGLGR